ncbi:MAG: outer membrane protein assembly factor BamB family protein [Acidimicrobiales bacterium]
MSFPRTTRAGTQLIIVLTLVLVATTACDWTQFRYAAGHSASSPDITISTATIPSFVQRWATTTGGAVGSSPAIAGGVAYVGSADHKLYAIDIATGAARWSRTTGGVVDSSPAVDNGTVYVGSNDHKLYAFRASDGAPRWSVTVDATFGGLSSAPTVGQGLIWVASSLGLYAFQPDGTPQRATPIATSGPLSPPSIAGNLVLTASYANATLRAFRIDTGALAWSASVPGPRASCTAATSSPAIDAGVAYVALCPAAATPSTSLFAYRLTDGAPIWSTGASALSSSPAVTSTSVYAASSSGQVLEAHDPATGALQWKAATGAVTSSPAAVNGVVYLGTDDHRLLGFDATGATHCAGSPKTCTPIWSVTTGGAVRSSPVASDGTVYVGSDDHQLHAYSFPIGFTMTVLQGSSSRFPIVGRFGPDGRFYVLQQYGTLKAYTVARNGPDDYRVTATETIDLIRQIPNHDDDGTLNPTVTTRQPTGMAITGTATDPVIYIASSDPRVGGGPSGTITNLDTNSGVISRLNRVNGVWQRLDLVRGLPRSEENHSTNALLLDSSTNTLYVAQGGNTNMGAPSHHMDYLPEYAYSAAVLTIDLNAIGNTTYDLPTLVDEDHPTLTGPFGGDQGKHQAKITPGSPVQVYAPGFRNPFSLVQTASRNLYVADNGSNPGWGDVPKNGGPGGTCTNDISEPGIDEADSVHRITGPGYYGGHANPTRGNRANTFNTTNPQSPVPVANPIECVSNGPTTNGSLAQIDAPTTGMAEYTATNFGRQLKGDLLLAGFLGGIYRVDLSPDGTSVLGTSMLFPDAGSHPIDVAVRSDLQSMPGTVWSLDYSDAGTIFVAEPNDYGG